MCSEVYLKFPLILYVCLKLVKTIDKMFAWLTSCKGWEKTPLHIWVITMFFLMWKLTDSFLGTDFPLLKYLN